MHTGLETVDGKFSADRGYLSLYFVTKMRGAA